MNFRTFMWNDLPVVLEYNNTTYTLNINNNKSKHTSIDECMLYLEANYGDIPNILSKLRYCSSNGDTYQGNKSIQTIFNRK